MNRIQNTHFKHGDKSKPNDKQISLIKKVGSKEHRGDFDNNPIWCNISHIIILRNDIFNI